MKFWYGFSVIWLVILTAFSFLRVDDLVVCGTYSLMDAVVDMILFLFIWGFGWLAGFMHND